MCIIRMKGNHENYGFLVCYFNKYFLSANKNNNCFMSEKQKDTALASLEFIPSLWFASFISKSLVSKCKIVAVIGGTKESA